MARLEIRDPDDNTIRVLRLIDGKPVSFPTNPEWEAELLSLRVEDPETGEVLTPAAGNRWLYALQLNYRSIYFRGVYVR